MKKIVSVLLAVMMIFGTLSVSFVSSAAYSDYSAPASDLPCIYIQGQGASIKTADGRDAYGGANDPGDSFDLMASVKECLPYLKDALLSNEWDTYRGKLLEIADQVYGLVRLDENGDPQYGTHLADTSWLPEQYKNKTTTGGKYAIRAYNFYIDWRLDPFETAKVLNNYIQSVKKATGKDKVNITARCEGCNVAAAYLAAYGTEDLNSLNLYIPTLMGADAISGVFSGKMGFDGQSLQRYKDQELSIDDPLIADLLDTTISLLNDTFATDGLLLALDPILTKLYKEVVTAFNLASYATMPGIWAIVGSCDDNYYEIAKKNIFAGKEEQYAGLIAKLDNYNEKVRKPIKQLLQNAADEGVKISVWAKYGNYSMIPVAPDNNLISDGTVTLHAATFGATQTHIGKVFSDSYMANAEKNGTLKYISADKVCDVSTALFPETTWVLYNSEHRQFPSDIHELIARFISADGAMTVDTYPEIPQFISCGEQHGESVSLQPLTAENGMQPDTTEKHSSQSITEKFVAFVRSVIALIKKYLQKYIDAFNSIQPATGTK